MTRVFDNPADFADDALAGFAAAYQEYVIRVDGGVVRATASRPGQVAVVIGGGSGHYPAFAGLVGTGLATAAVCGNIFASPSAGQVYRVARAAESGAGVLFSYGNYAGDRMQFGQAEQRLRSSGIDARTVIVTDDIASAPLEQMADRRGIAGDLTVFKVAGSAAESGLGLDEVERLAHKANLRTRTLGVAFAGCTLPGAPRPLFTVPAGQMSVGLGIHGEPGIMDVVRPTAHDLAEMLVARLLAERPEGSAERAVVLLNGLGAIKYEELFLLFGKVAVRLAAAGVEVADVECGELVTSLDMAGLSLTLFWTDEELEALWSAPADTPGFRKQHRPLVERRQVSAADADVAPQPASTASRRLARLAELAIRIASEAVHEHESELGDLDAVAGDGDHGAGMCRGSEGAAEAARDGVSRGIGVREVLIAAGDEWSERAGGASGALWGAALIALGSSLGNRDSYKMTDLEKAVTAARDAMVVLGQASLGDKTIIDAASPFVEVLAREISLGSGLPKALRVSADAARSAAASTARLRPRKGRARPLADRSVGTPDPGAVSFAIVVAALAAQASALAHENSRRQGD